MKRFAGSILLLALAVAVGIYAFVLDTEGPAERASASEHRLLPGFTSHLVTRIEVSANAKSLTLERPLHDDAGTKEFAITTPSHARADAATVLALLRAADTASYLRKVPRERDLGAPHCTVTITTPTGPLRLSAYGAAPQPSHSVYLAVDGSMYVVSAEIADLLTPPLDHFRDPRLLVEPFEDLSSVTIVSGTQTTRIVRDNLGAWKLPSGQRASRRTLRELFAAAESMTAESFVDKAKEGSPSETLTFTWNREHPATTLRFYRGCGDASDAWTVVVGGTEQIRACVARSGTAKLFMSGEDFEDRHVFETSLSEVSEIVIAGTSPDERTELARVDSLFRQKAPREQLLGRDESDTVTRALDRMLDLEGEFVDGGEATAGAPVSAVTLFHRTETGETEETVAFRKSKRGFVASRSDGVAVRIPDAAVADFTPRDFTATGN